MLYCHFSASFSVFIFIELKKSSQMNYTFILIAQSVKITVGRPKFVFVQMYKRLNGCVKSARIQRMYIGKRWLLSNSVVFWLYRVPQRTSWRVSSPFSQSVCEGSIIKNSYQGQTTGKGALPSSDKRRRGENGMFLNAGHAIWLPAESDAAQLKTRADVVEAGRALTMIADDRAA